MAHCLNSTDCLFFEECTEHWSGICPGHCEWSTWFLSLVTWTCIGTLIAVALCIRCEFCPLHRLICRDSSSGLRPFKGRHDYSREVSSNNQGIASFHQVVLARSFSQQSY
jgi:hypothetical protein